MWEPLERGTWTLPPPAAITTGVGPTCRPQDELLTAPGDLCTPRGTATSFTQLACPLPPSSAQTPGPGIHHI